MPSARAAVLHVRSGQLCDHVSTARGELSFAPPNTPLTLSEFRGRDARVLLPCTAAVFEPYFDRLAQGGPALPPNGQAIVVGPQPRRGG
jgi:hypothetical protein